MHVATHHESDGIILHGTTVLTKYLCISFHARLTFSIQLLYRDASLCYTAPHAYFAHVSSLSIENKTYKTKLQTTSNQEIKH